MSSNNSSVLPPPPNPILNAYEQFVQETPFVTRSILTTLCITWLLGLVVDLSYATATVPYFCVFKFELYRIVISPLICQNILSLVFAFLSFTDNGKRLEHSMGSAAFGWYLLTVAVCTNVAFLLLLFLANGLTGEPGFLWYRSVGIWTILFGIIAADCSQAPSSDIKRRLFFFTVPTIYYPIALWGLFALMGGFDLADLLSVCVGYGYGHGYLDKLKLTPSRFHQWEETVLANFVQRPGWVAGHDATGEDAWTNNATVSHLQGRQCKMQTAGALQIVNKMPNRLLLSFYFHRALAPASFHNFPSSLKKARYQVESPLHRIPPFQRQEVVPWAAVQFDGQLIERPY
jgi:membrane associated rhomboid family serine protease